MTEPKLTFSYLYSRPDVTANQDYADIATYGENHRLGLGVDLDLLKRDGWVLSDGSLIAEGEYSYYLGEERNEESHSKEFGVGVGWKQTLLKRDDDLINLNVTPMFRLGRAQNKLNFGRGFPVEEESSTNGAFAILAGADLCGDYFCITPTVGYGWEKTLTGFPAHERNGLEGGFNISLDLFREEKAPTVLPNLAGMLDTFLKGKAEEEREKIKEELLDYLKQRISQLRDSEPPNDKAYQTVSDELRNHIDNQLDEISNEEDDTKRKQLKKALLAYIDEQLVKLKKAEFQRADHYQAIASDLHYQANLEETAVRLPGIIYAIDHAMARDQIFRMPFGVRFPFGSSELSFGTQWRTIGTPAALYEKREDKQAFECFSHPSLDDFLETFTRLGTRLYRAKKAGRFQDKYRLRVVVKGYANDLKRNEQDNSPKPEAAGEDNKNLGNVLRRLAYQRAQTVIDYILHQDQTFHQESLYAKGEKNALRDESQARKKELEKLGWRTDFASSELCSYRGGVSLFSPPFNRDDSNNLVFEIVNATSDSDPFTQIHEDFAGIKGVDIENRYFQSAHIKIEVYKNDAPEPLHGAALDEFISNILSAVEGNDESIIIQ